MTDFVSATVFIGIPLFLLALFVEPVIAFLLIVLALMFAHLG